MHENAIRAVERKIRRALCGCHVDSSGSSPTITLPEKMWIPLSDELKKHKPRWIDDEEVITVLYVKINDAISSTERGGPSNQTRLDNYLSEQEFSKLCEELLSFFRSIPRTLTATIPFGHTDRSVPESIPISETLGLRSIESERTGLISRVLDIAEDPISPKRIVLDLSVEGCPTFVFGAKISRHALLSGKVLIQHALSSGLLELKGTRFSGGLLGASRVEVDRASLLIKDLNDGSLLFPQITLPLDHSVFFENLRFCASTSNSNSSAGVGKSVEDLEKCLLFAEKILKSEAAGSDGVRAACSWSVDARISEDPVIAFIQVCIGLESLFGEGVENGTLTSTLADRCAFALAPTISERELIRDRFRKLYGVRSRLVHGRDREFTVEQRSLLQWGMKILDQSIKEEGQRL